MTPIKLKIKNNISYLEGTKTKWDNVYGDFFYIIGNEYILNMTSSN